MITGLELTYEMRRALRHDVGLQAAAVFDVLAHNDPGDRAGVEMTTRKLAQEANISPKSVCRAIGQLVEAGLITSEKQFQNNRQIANRYYVSYLKGGGHSHHPGGQDDQPIGTDDQAIDIKSQEVVDVDVVLSSFDSLLVSGKSRAGSSREGLRPSGDDFETQKRDSNDSKEWDGVVPVGVEDSARQIELRWPWPPRNSPMPMPVGGQHVSSRCYLEILNNAMWLVSYFEGYVVDKHNQDKVAKGRKPIDEIPERRKRKWFDNAQTLVSVHPVWEVAEVIDWVFNTCAGHLPTWVAETHERSIDTKVTSIRQVAEVYDVLVEEMYR